MRLREARKDQPRIEAKRELEAVREAVRGEYSTGDMGQLLVEIERGYLADDVTGG